MMVREPSINDQRRTTGETEPGNGIGRDHIVATAHTGQPAIRVSNLRSALRAAPTDELSSVCPPSSRPYRWHVGQVICDHPRVVAQRLPMQHAVLIRARLSETAFEDLWRRPAP